MRPARNVLVALAVVVPALAAACVDVPDLRFVDDLTDGASEDAGGDAADDAGDDAGDDAATIEPDAGPATCAPPAPAGGTCCGAVYCFESCGPASCAACAAKGCAVGEVCCGKNGNVVCKAKCP